MGMRAPGKRPEAGIDAVWLRTRSRVNQLEHGEWWKQKNKRTERR